MRSSDALSAVADVVADQHGAFTRRQAANAGFSRRQIHQLIANKIVTEPVRGVLVMRTSPPTWRQHQMVANLAPPGFHAGCRAAGYLHQVDGVGPEPPHDILGPRNIRKVHIEGLSLVQHWVGPIGRCDLVTVDGISCTSLARTVVELCGLGDRDLAQRAVDDFERRMGSLRWLRHTAERLDRPGQSGTRLCLELIDRRKTGGRVPNSWFERLVERCLVIPGLPPWVRQHEVRNGAGRLIATIDLGCPVLEFGVESHSREFHFGQRTEALDQRRENKLAAVGYHLVHVGWHDTDNPATVAKTIEEIAHRRAEQLGIPLPWTPPAKP